VTERLSELQIYHLDAAHAFHPHNRRIRNLYFPEGSLSDLRQDPLIEYWCENPRLFTSLRILLPFRRILSHSQVDFLVAPYWTTHLVNNCSTQLLYWYLARADASLSGQLVSHIAIYPELDQFWFNYIASNSQQIKDRLLRGHKVFYLQRFTLSHDSIDLEFSKLRLITVRYGSLPAAIQAPFRIVHTTGRTHRYSWNTNSWELSTSNPDPALVDPEPPYFLPPLAPADPDYQIHVQEPLRYYTPDIDERIRGPSESPSSPTTSSIPSVDSPPLPPLETNVQLWGPPPQGDQGWNNRPASWILNNHCWCNNEVCDCGFRPNTPPTPPDVVLWSPGNNYLPYHS
jgi:hypothetical protein